MKPPKIIEFEYDPNPARIQGFYDEDVPGYIYINRYLTTFGREIVIAHETQHARCCEEKCSCFDLYADVLREYHAFRAEFEYMVTGRHTTNAWRMYYRIVRDALKRYQGRKIWEGHFKALAKVCRLKLFKEYSRGCKPYKQIMKLVSEGAK